MIGRLRFATGTSLSTPKQSEAALKPSGGEMFAAGWTTRRSRAGRMAGWFGAGVVALAALVGSCREGLGQAYTFATATTVGASQSQAVPVTVTRAGTVNAIEVLTQGISGLDYTEVSSTFSVGTSYAANTPGTVTVQFAPQYPGLRTGGVVLVDASGNVLGTTLVYGTGTGPLSVMNVGQLTTVAGEIYNQGAAAVGGPGTANPTLTPTTNPINIPTGVAVDGAGNFYYSDSADDVIYKVTTSGPNAGDFATIAGTIGAVGYSGDGGPASAALLNVPNQLLLDGAGNLYFSDSGNNVVREIIGATGTTVGKIVTVVGNGTANFTGDGGRRPPLRCTLRAGSLLTATATC